MLSNIIGAVLQAKAAEIKRKATGAVVQMAAFGLFGVSLIFGIVSGFLWLAGKMDPWLAALAIAIVVLIAAIVLMLIGRMIMQQKSKRDREQTARALGESNAIVQALTGTNMDGKGTNNPSLELIAAALATGIILGRSLGR
ncbi:phage holin family protein [Rhodophyticola sp. MJ-SS7]|nr:phage holin family protein [Rhodophyticola sp. MJ-SS7]